MAASAQEDPGLLILLRWATPAFYSKAMNKPLLVGLAVVASAIAVTSRISSMRRGWIDEVWRFGMDGIDERPDDEQWS